MNFNIVIRNSRIDAILNIFKSDSDIFLSNSIGPETRQELKDIAAQIEKDRKFNRLMSATNKANKKVEKKLRKAGL